VPIYREPSLTSNLNRTTDPTALLRSPIQMYLNRIAESFSLDYDDDCRSRAPSFHGDSLQVFIDIRKHCTGSEATDFPANLIRCGARSIQVENSVLADERLTNVVGGNT